MLDGLLENDTILRPREHSTDTHGYTEHLFGLCYLLGFSFMPRLRGLADQQLYKIDRGTTYGRLEPLFRGGIDTELIREQWDQLVRIASSLRQRTAPAHVVVQRLAGSSPSDRVAKALTALGRVVKTIYILRYLHEEDVRRRVQLQLNRGESRHDLARWLFFANQGEFRTGDYEEIMNKASCLSLLSNAVLVWNTVRMGEIVARLRAAGRDGLGRGPGTDFPSGLCPRDPQRDLRVRPLSAEGQHCGQYAIVGFRRVGAGTPNRPGTPVMVALRAVGPYGVRIDNLLSISRSFVGGGSVPRSESPDGAGSYRTAPQGPLFRVQSRKSVGPYGVRIDNLLSISRSFVGGGSVPRSESPDGAGSYRTAPQGPLFRAQSRKSVGPYGVRIDNLLSISRSFVGGGSVPRSESPDGAGSYRTAPQGPLFRAQSRKSVDSTSVTSLRRAHLVEFAWTFG